MNINNTLLCTTLLASVCLFVTPAQSATPNQSPRVSESVDRIFGKSQTITSTVLGQERAFSIYLPRGYDLTTRSYPVMFVLDGDVYAAWIAETVRLLSFQRQIPPMIVVGIANINRTYDLTPLPIDDDTSGTGGGKNFLKFLKTELVPHIDREYRTEDLRILFGHSFGGSFTVYSLFAEPDLFRAGLAISPALYSDRGKLLRKLEESIDSGRAFPTNFLYLTIGNELGYSEALDFLTDNLEQNPPPGLRWKQQRFPEETHASIVIRSMVLGLNALFTEYPMKVIDFQAGYEAIDRHFKNVSKSLGYQVKIPEYMANNLGYEALAIPDIPRAKLIFESNVRNYPRSANVYDSLAEAYLKEGDLMKAITLYEKSLELNPGNENGRMMIQQIRARD